MPVYAYHGVTPRISRTAYVHPDAVVIGNVTLGPEASVWPGAVLRGDHGLIEIGARTSVQDGTVVHTTAEYPTVVAADCVVGHNAHLEGCLVQARCLVGSMSTVLQRVVVGERSVVGAGAVVPEGLQVPPDSMVLGVPARVRPRTTADHDDWLDRAVGMYVDNAREYPTRQRVVRLEDCLVDDLPD